MEKPIKNSFSYARFEQHLELPNVGIEGQTKIHSAKVLIVGAGGLGCPSSLYLAASGVGTLGLMDEDKVSVSNLQRQILYGNDDVGKSKIEAASARLNAIIYGQEIKAYPFFLDETNAEDIIRDYDVVIDATDNHITRLVINKICLKLQKPWVYGALFHFEGHLMSFLPGEDRPCFKCAFPHLDENSVLPTCKSAGILSPVAGIIGCMQATETLKIILELNNESSPARLLLCNFLTYNHDLITIPKNPLCQICGSSGIANDIPKASGNRPRSK